MRAPFDGEIGIVRISPGAYVSPNDPIVDLATLGDLRVNFSVPVTVADRLDPGGSVRVMPPESDSRIEAYIEVIDPLVGSESRQVAMEAVLPEEAGPLRPGTFVAVAVPTIEREDALFVPETAVRWAGPQAVVFVVGDDLTARRVPVEIGARRDGRVVVRGEGLAAGARVVSSGVQKVRDGAKLTGADGGGEKPGPS